ncbi:hypothetical protein [Microbulbifer epialgicus]|uniref:Lipoprotein n=1 Tax=Microbulbifer epialgicus TaxID=393907 RepID=A0ABV4NVF8_9GAMM
MTTPILTLSSKKGLSNTLKTILTFPVLLSACSGEGTGGDYVTKSSPAQPTPTIPPCEPRAPPSTITRRGVFDEIFENLPKITVSIVDTKYITGQVNDNEFNIEVNSGHDDELATFTAKNFISTHWNFTLQSYAGSF